MKQDLLSVVTTVVVGITIGLLSSAALFFLLNRTAEMARAFL